MNVNRFPLAVLCATLTMSVASLASGQETGGQEFKIATPVEEVVQLNKSGVGDAVILTYIENSDRTFRLNAQDIIKLRDEGVSTEVTTALIRRGAEQREAAEQASAQQQKPAEPAPAETVAVAPTYQTAPAPTVVAAPVVTYYEPPRSTVSVTYFGTPRYNYYYTPSYYARSHYYSCGPSYYYSPRVSVGFGYRSHHGYASYRSGGRHCR